MNEKDTGEKNDAMFKIRKTKEQLRKILSKDLPDENGNVEPRGANNPGIFWLARANPCCHENSKERARKPTTLGTLQSVWGGALGWSPHAQNFCRAGTPLRPPNRNGSGQSV